MAAELAAAELEARAGRNRALVARLAAGLDELPGVSVFAAGAERLPNTLMFALDGIDGETLLMALDREGLAVSSGSACHTGSGAPSHVLAAMGVPEAVARGAVRVSFGLDSTPADVDALLAGLQRQAAALRRLAATA